MRTLWQATLLALVAGPRIGQGQAYRPSYNDRFRPEVVAVYLGATTCAPCRAPWMPAVLDSVKVQLQRQAHAHGREFAAVFVAMDWYIDSALALANASGAWDELSIGRNWANSGAQLYIWGDTATAPAMPQIIVYLQEQRPAGARLGFSERRVLRRVRGADALRAWASEGSPLVWPSEPN